MAGVLYLGIAVFFIGGMQIKCSYLINNHANLFYFILIHEQAGNVLKPLLAYPDHIS